MISSQIVENSPYREYINLLLRLHDLICEGKGESDEAEAVRDQMDVPWTRMNAEQLARVRGISADLATLEPDPPIQHADDPRVFDDALAVGLQLLWKADQHEKILALLRQKPELVSSYRAARLRGRAYELLGELAVAERFYESAWKSNSQEVIAAFEVALVKLRLQRFDEVVEIVGRVSGGSEKLTPMVTNALATMLFLASQSIPGREQELLLQAVSLYELVDQQLRRFLSSKSSLQRDQVFSLIGRGICWLRLGDSDKAEIFFSEALEVDPENADAAVFRGMVRLEENRDQALEDFESAVKHGAAVIWPFYYLAHAALEHGDYVRCVELCARGRTFLQDHSLLSQMLQWNAIASAFLEAPVQEVLYLFREALDLSPSDSNLARMVSLLEHAIAMDEEIKNQLIVDTVPEPPGIDRFASSFFDASSLVGSH